MSSFGWLEMCGGSWAWVSSGINGGAKTSIIYVTFNPNGAFLTNIAFVAALTRVTSRMWSQCLVWSMIVALPLGFCWFWGAFRKSEDLLIQLRWKLSHFLDVWWCIQSGLLACLYFQTWYCLLKMGKCQWPHFCVYSRGLENKRWKAGLVGWNWFSLLVYVLSLITVYITFKISSRHSKDQHH